MEHTARGNSFSKRARKVGALSASSEAERSPPHKKPKYRRPPPDTKAHSSALGEGDMQDRKYAEDFVSIRHAVEDIRLMGRDFYQEQQRRYKDMQSLGEEFHQLQQKQFDGLMEWISETEQRVDRQLREIKEMKSEPQKKEEDKDVLLGLRNHAIEGVPPDKGDTDMDAEERTAPTLPTRISPALLPTGRGNLESPPDILQGIYRGGHETEPSGREIGENDPPRFAAQGNRKQLSRDSSLISRTEEQRQLPEPASPSKSGTRHPRGVRAPKSSIPSPCIDPSDGDDEESAGVLNDDWAIEDMEIGPGSLDAETESGQQHHSPSATLSGQHQPRLCTANRSTTPSPDRVKNNPPQPGRSLRKRRSIDYYKLGPSISESEELSAPPLNETPSKDFAKTPSKDFAKTPVKRKPRKNGHESPYVDSAKESPVKDGTSRKKSASKSSGGMKPGSMDKFLVRQAPNQGPIPIPPLREIDGDQPLFLPSPDDDEPELVNRNPPTLQPETPSKPQSTGVFPQAPIIPLNKPIVGFSGSHAHRNFGEKNSDAATAGASKYRAVRTSPIS